MMKKWSNLIYDQVNLIDDSFNQALKFSQYQISPLLEVNINILIIFILIKLIKQRDFAEKEYVEYSTKLI